MSESTDQASTPASSPLPDQISHDVQLQHIIDRLAENGRGADHDRLVADLESAVAERGLGPMPQTWLDAVASAAASGDAYVVSKPAAQLSDVPPPSTHRPGKTIT